MVFNGLRILYVQKFLSSFLHSESLLENGQDFLDTHSVISPMRYKISVHFEVLKFDDQKCLMCQYHLIYDY